MTYTTYNSQFFLSKGIYGLTKGNIQPVSKKMLFEKNGTIPLMPGFFGTLTGMTKPFYFVL